MKKKEKYAEFSEYKPLIDDMVWSYSRIALYEACPYAFYLRYIFEDEEESPLYPAEGNFYADLGKFVHSIFEKILKGELDQDDASQYFLDHYEDEIENDASHKIMNKAINDVVMYLSEMDLFDWLRDYSIEGVELKFEDEIEGYKIIGFIDLLLKSKKTGDYVVVDHKSSKKMLNKKGKPYANMVEKFEGYKKQAYLYARYVKRNFGVYPVQFWWHLFKENGFIEKIDFNLDEYKKTEEWLISEIKEIEKDGAFSENINYFYCHNLCDFRRSCEYNEVS